MKCIICSTAIITFSGVIGLRWDKNKREKHLLYSVQCIYKSPVSCLDFFLLFRSSRSKIFSCQKDFLEKNTIENQLRVLTYNIFFNISRF